MTDSKRFRTSPMLSSFCINSASATTARKSEMCCAMPWLCEVRQLASAELFGSCSSPPSNESKSLPSVKSALQILLGRCPNNDATTKLDQLWMFNLDFDTTNRRRGGRTTNCHGFVETGAAARGFVRPRLCFRFLFIVSYGNFCGAKCSKSHRVHALLGCVANCSSLILMRACHTRSASSSPRVSGYIAFNARI